MCIQVDVPGFKARDSHSADVINLCPGVTEVTLFGGLHGYNYLANTVVLRFGELNLSLSHTTL